MQKVQILQKFPFKKTLKRQKNTKGNFLKLFAEKNFSRNVGTETKSCHLINGEILNDTTDKIIKLTT